MMDSEEFYFENEEFDDVEELEEPLWKKIGKGLVAFVAILGLLYFSGIYQGFLFQRTPSDTKQDEVVGDVIYEAIEIPLNVFVVVGGEQFGSFRTQADVEQLVNNADAIWKQAGVSLEIKSLQFVEVSDSEVLEFLENPSVIIKNISNYDRNAVNVFLTKTLQGINGVAYGGLRTTAVADYTTVRDFRTFAHEIGHVLGLGHTQVRDRLMAQGTNGVNLSDDEINRAREYAQNFSNE